MKLSFISFDSITKANRTVLDLDDVLGGDYDKRKKLMNSWREQVYDVLPKILCR